MVEIRISEKEEFIQINTKEFIKVVPNKTSRLLKFIKVNSNLSSSISIKLISTEDSFINNYFDDNFNLDMFDVYIQDYLRYNLYNSISKEKFQNIFIDIIDNCND